MRHLAGTGLRQKQETLGTDGCLQRRAALLPIRKKLGKRDRVNHRARQYVSADLRSLFEHAYAQLTVLTRRQLFQPYRSSKARRAAADNDDVIFHRFAL